MSRNSRDQRRAASEIRHTPIFRRRNQLSGLVHPLLLVENGVDSGRVLTSRCVACAE